MKNSFNQLQIGRFRMLVIINNTMENRIYFQIYFQITGISGDDLPRLFYFSLLELLRNRFPPLSTISHPISSL